MFFSIEFPLPTQPKAPDQGNPLLDREEEDDVIVEPLGDRDTLTLLEVWLLRPITFFETEKLSPGFRLRSNWKCLCLFRGPSPSAVRPMLPLNLIVPRVSSSSVLLKDEYPDDSTWERMEGGMASDPVPWAVWANAGCGNNHRVAASAAKITIFEEERSNTLSLQGKKMLGVSMLSCPS